MKVQEANYKVLTSWYKTTVVLHKKFPDSSANAGNVDGIGLIVYIFWDSTVYIF